jgi:hypothetical protein
MFDRRTLLKSLGVAAVPAVASSTPSVAISPSATQIWQTKVRDTGILQLHFDCTLWDGDR